MHTANKAGSGTTQCLWSSSHDSLSESAQVQILNRRPSKPRRASQSIRCQRVVLADILDSELSVRTSDTTQVRALASRARRQHVQILRRLPLAASVRVDARSIAGVLRKDGDAVGYEDTLGSASPKVPF